jgi:hypothetical protein
MRVGEGEQDSVDNRQEAPQLVYLASIAGHLTYKVLHAKAEFC